MGRHIGRPGKLHVAQITAIRLLSRVPPQMYDQVGRGAKAMATVNAQIFESITLLRIFALVIVPDVHFEVVLSIERLRAKGTFEFLLRNRMGLYVPVQGVSRFKALLANLALISPAAGVLHFGLRMEG